MKPIKMEKNDIDKGFVLVYSSIRNYSIKALRHFKSNIELEHLLSETYLYIEKNKDKIDNISVLESFCKGFIKNSIRWTNSELNRSSKNRLDVICLDRVEYVVSESKNIDYSNYSALYSNFFKSLTNYDKRLFNIWFNLEIKNGKELSEYLKISLSMSYRTIKECKALELRFKAYILSNYVL